MGQHPITLKNFYVKKLLNKPRTLIKDNRNENGNRKTIRILRIGTWNIRTLFKPGALKIIIDEITKYNLQIVALQEIRWPDKGSIKHKETTIFYSGCGDERHEFGVGFVINDRLLHNVNKFEAINKRICFIRLKISGQNIIIINCHSPTEDKDAETKDAFYEKMERTYDSLPRRAIKIIIGDMNAKICRKNVFRPTIGKESLHIVSNDNGTRFISFAMSRDIIITSTYFQRKDIYKQTWVSPDATTKNQIDHVTIDKLHCSWFKNIRSYRGADGDTDHYLVVATLTEKLSVSWKKNKGRNKKVTNTIDIDRLKDPIEVTQYRTRVAEELRNINERVENTAADSHESKWTTIKKVINFATKNLKTESRSSKKNSWFNNECMEAVKKRNEARLNMIQNSSIENQTKYKHYKEIVNKTTRREKRLAEKKALEKLEEERINPRKFFKHCKYFKQGFKQQTSF